MPTRLRAQKIDTGFRFVQKYYKINKYVIVDIQWKELNEWE